MDDAIIKPLEWEDGYAVDPVSRGHWSISYHDVRKKWVVSSYGFPDAKRIFADSEEAAKAAAQQDFNARILAALDPAWLARVKAMEEALQRLVAWKDAVEITAPELGGLLVAFYHADAALKGSQP